LRVYVKLFGVFRRYLPNGSEKPSFWLEIGNEAMIEDLFTLFGIPGDLPNVIVCNHRIARKEDILQNGAVVAIFPPLAGG
jgi:molybdopterin converting factor small subunit